MSFVLPGWTGIVLAGVGLAVAFTGALVSPKAGLVAVVATLPFFLFPWQLGSQTIALHELMLFVTAAAVGVRAGASRLLGDRLVALTRSAGQKLGGKDALRAVAPAPSPTQSGHKMVLQPPPPHAGAGGQARLSRSEGEAASEGAISASGRGRLGRIEHVNQTPPRPRAGEGHGGARGDAVGLRGSPWGVSVPWTVFDWPIALLLAAALLSLFATEYLRLSLRELRTLIVEPILFWYLCRAVLRTQVDVAWLVGALLAATTVVAVIGLVQLVAGGAVTDVQGVRRVQGTYMSPNHFALLLGRVLPFLLAGAWLLPRWRPWLVPMGLLCAGALAATFSLGGWAGTGAAILVVVWLLGGRRWLLVLVVASAILAAAVLIGAPTERLAGRLDPTQGTNLVRVQLWQAALQLVQQSPLLGIGMDNFLYRYPPLVPDDTPFEPNLSHPHNLLLQIWLELGLLGLAAMLWLLATFVRLIWSRASVATPTDGGAPLGRALAVGALASMTDFVIHGLVDNSYFLPDMAVIFWLTLSVAVLSAEPLTPTASGPRAG